MSNFIAKIYVVFFFIYSSLSTPSDDAPISLAMNCAYLKSTPAGDQLLCHASHLGDHEVLHNTVCIDFDNFQWKLELIDPTALPN